MDFVSVAEYGTSILKILLAIILVGASGIVGRQIFLALWKESLANEWLLVIRNGKLTKSGIGLCTYIMPGDQCVKFPSLISQVNFTAQQVTSEMQGVEVSGMLIWSILRNDDGPFRAYKCFGEDLANSTPHMANQKLESMAVSIIRDRIANFTINDILKNRSKLRNGVKDEMQKILSGWGIWLETCEIQDVKISSKSLFLNLQTEFREKSRMEAEQIQANTENTIKEEALLRQQKYNKIKTESETTSKIFAGE